MDITPYLPQITYAVFGLLTLYGVVAPILGFVRVKKDQVQARNKLSGVTMITFERAWATGQSYYGILAHEICEFWLRWFGALSISAVPAFYFGNPMFVIGTFLVALVIDKFTPLYKQMDLIGRAVETTVADKPGYLHEEAQRLVDGTRGNFANYEVHVVADMISRRFWIARILVALLGRSWKS